MYAIILKDDKGVYIMICRKCGKDNPDTAQKCFFCGEDLETISNNNSINQNLYSNTMLNNNSDNDLGIFGVPEIQNNLGQSNLQLSNSKKEILFDYIEENKEKIVNNTVNTNAETQPNNLRKYNFSADNIQNINNSPNVRIDQNKLNEIGSVDKENELSENSVLNNVKSNTSSSMNKKKNGGKILFVLAVILVVVALILILIPILNKQGNRLDDINKNSKVNVDNSGDISGKVKISVNNISYEYDVYSNYYKNEGALNIKIELSRESEMLNAYMDLSSTKLNIYIPSQFIDLFGKTKSEEIQWIKYSIDFFNEIDIDNYKLAELFDENHFKYINDVNDTKHYRLLLDNKIFSSNNSVEYLDNVNLELYTNKNNFITRFATVISNIGESKSTIDVDIKFKEDNSSVVIIPKEALNTELTLQDYIENNKLEV